MHVWLYVLTLSCHDGNDIAACCNPIKKIICVLMFNCHVHALNNLYKMRYIYADKFRVNERGCTCQSARVIPCEASIYTMHMV